MILKLFSNASSLITIESKRAYNIMNNFETKQKHYSSSLIVRGSNKKNTLARKLHKLSIQYECIYKQTNQTTY